MNLLVHRVAPTAEVLTEVGAYVDAVSLLGPAERERYERLRQPVDRHDFVAARALARMLVLAQRGESLTSAGLCAVRFEQRCETCGGPHGRPTIVEEPRLTVSWAHAKGVVATAVGHRPVGVDVERMAPDPPPGLSGDGARPWLVWTRAEALTKLGLADLETTLSWSAWLSHPASETGRRVDLPENAVATITDQVDDVLGVVCAVALPGRVD